jgi:hypothetical protein
LFRLSSALSHLPELHTNIRDDRLQTHSRLLLLPPPRLQIPLSVINLHPDRKLRHLSAKTPDHRLPSSRPIALHLSQPRPVRQLQPQRGRLLVQVRGVRELPAWAGFECRAVCEREVP